jgi:hypothetical protein
MQSRAHFTLSSLIEIQKAGWELTKQTLLHRKWKWISQNFRLLFRKQTWLIMRLTAILLLSACLQVSATGFSQDVTLSGKNVSLQKIFNQIHKQTGYQFFYEDEMLNKTGRINIKVKDMPLEKALAICFKGLPLSYSVVNNVITLKRKTGDLIQNVNAPAFISIKGTIKDAQGQPLVGVSVVVKGTNRGTSTTADGSFLIDASAEDVLEFTFVGYQTQTLRVGKETEINVVLKLDVTGLSDVVIVGFGTQKKVSLTGAVSQITGAELTKRPVSNVQQALQGLSPGVTVVDPGGVPGRSNATIRVRGVTTLNNNDPLVIVDGIEQKLAEINPQDIESISILKDAASTSIYGSRVPKW